MCFGLTTRSNVCVWPNREVACALKLNDVEVQAPTSPRSANLGHLLSWQCWVLDEPFLIYVGTRYAAAVMYEF